MLFKKDVGNIKHEVRYKINEAFPTEMKKKTLFPILIQIQTIFYSESRLVYGKIWKNSLLKKFVCLKNIHLSFPHAWIRTQ
jgi:hypothetical protein